MYSSIKRWSLISPERSHFSEFILSRIPVIDTSISGCLKIELKEAVLEMKKIKFSQDLGESSSIFLEITELICFRKF